MLNKVNLSNNDFLTDMTRHLLLVCGGGERFKGVYYWTSLDLM